MQRQELCTVSNPAETLNTTYNLLITSSWFIETPHKHTHTCTGCAVFNWPGFRFGVEQT